jgi:hypothetical protein
MAMAADATNGAGPAAILAAAGPAAILAAAGIDAEDDAGT